jgi:tripartite-type tricarboxylate transporter receptor subunit TctC
MQLIKRRTLDGALTALTCIVAGASLLMTTSEVRSQEYPTRAITLVVPWPAGGTMDVVARMLGSKLADRVGKPVIVENHPGAGSVIGATAVARAVPDGYTLLLSGVTGLAVNPAVFRKLPYDAVKDFAPLALIVGIPLVLVVHPSLPVYSVSDLIKLAREKPGQLSFASAGLGSPQHLFAQLLISMTGVQIVHVPYRGGPQALTDVTAGHIPLVFGDPVSSLPLIREGKVRALGVSSSSRLASAPDIPTVAEAGVPGFEAVAWSMIVAPANTPGDIVMKLHVEIKSIMAVAEFQQHLTPLGLSPIDSPPPEELRRFVNTEIVRWRKVVEEAGITGSQ